MDAKVPTTQTKRTASVAGFVQFLSPKKISKKNGNPYYTFQVQTEENKTIIYHYHHHNQHHLSLSSSQPPPSVTIIITTTTSVTAITRQVEEFLPKQIFGPEVDWPLAGAAKRLWVEALDDTKLTVLLCKRKIHLNCDRG